MKSLGQVAYEAWLSRTGNAFTPTWDKLSSVAKVNWEFVASSVVAAIPPKTSPEPWKSYYQSGLIGSLSFHAGLGNSGETTESILDLAKIVADRATQEHIKKFGA